MTTEQALREALTGLLSEYDDYGDVADMLGPDVLRKVDAAKEALALPASESRQEWCVRYTFTEAFAKERRLKGWSSVTFRNKVDALQEQARIDAHDHIASSRIESHAVTTSPWTEIKP